MTAPTEQNQFTEGVDPEKIGSYARTSYAPTEPEKIPLREDNPNGLHLKYRIQKFSHFKTKKGFFGWTETNVPVFKDVDPDSEYFILRLDDKQKDPKHREACIKAVLTYAEAIKDHIPQLSKDLIERYGK